jgi:uncharacterized protein (TIGR03435 family)
MLRGSIVLVVVCLSTAVIQAKPPQVAPAFEAASVKPSAPDAQGQHLRREPGGRVSISNVPLRELIKFVYQLQDFQIDGVPAWASSESFDIVAKAAEDVPPVLPGTAVDPLIVMLRTLLADRFRLQVHRESREMPAYALVLSKPGVLGAGLKRSTTDCPAIAREQQATRSAQPSSVGSQCGFRAALGVITSGGFPLSQLLNPLSQLVRRPVVDRTGLQGGFDYELRFAPENLQAGAPNAADPGGASVFTALQEQLGLKLEPARVPIEVLVVDHIERPTSD